jgi:hypothetical protein
MPAKHPGTLLGGILLVIVGAGLAFVLGGAYLAKQVGESQVNSYLLPLGVYDAVFCIIGWFATRGKASAPFWYLLLGGLIPGAIMGWGWCLVHRGLSPDENRPTV